MHWGCLSLLKLKKRLRKSQNEKGDKVTGDTQPPTEVRIV